MPPWSRPLAFVRVQLSVSTFNATISHLLFKRVIMVEHITVSSTNYAYDGEHHFARRVKL